MDGIVVVDRRDAGATPLLASAAVAVWVRAIRKRRFFLDTTAQFRVVSVLTVQPGETVDELRTS